MLSVKGSFNELKNIGPDEIKMMGMMSIPEQVVLWTMAPELSPMAKLSVSAAMFAIHFTFNGFVMKTPKTHQELVWIIGTAAYAKLLGVKTETAVALVAADSIMTLALRDQVE